MKTTKNAPRMSRQLAYDALVETYVDILCAAETDEALYQMRAVIQSLADRFGFDEGDVLHEGAARYHAKYTRAEG